jgi:hypothetical protein
MQEKKPTTQGVEHQHREYAEGDSRYAGSEEVLPPRVDSQHASTIEVSKLHGKWLTWMVSPFA